MDFPSLGTVVAGKYRLEALLGVGGMGAVYRARHAMMETPVAVKYLRDDMIENEEARGRLVREARSISRIQHPNVVQVFDVDTHDGAPFLVMEYLEGETFGDLMAKQALSAQQVVQVLCGALEGLAAAHAMGIVHRDIKPENIFIVKSPSHPDGLAKLLDFGVSKTDSLDEASKRLTQTGSAVGTPLYMSVEQLTHSSEVDHRADVYSFGVLLYHALTGALPFDGDSFAAVVLSIATTKPRTLRQLRPELPAALDRVVMKAMARRRDDRYASAKDLIAALQGIEDSLGTEPLPPSTVADTLTPRLSAHDLGDVDREAFALLKDARNRRRGLRIAAAVAALTMAGLFVWSRSGGVEARGLSAREQDNARVNPTEGEAVAVPVMVEPSADPQLEQRPDAPLPHESATPDFVVTRPRTPSRVEETKLDEPAAEVTRESRSEAREAREARRAAREAARSREEEVRAPVRESGGLLREDF